MATIADFKVEWFRHSQWWFSKLQEYDEYITTNFGHLLDAPDASGPLALILLYDQLPRHVFRNTSSNHIIEYYLEKAIDVVLSVRDTGYERSLAAIEWTFFMLPLRHTRNAIVICKYVIKKTWTRMCAPGTSESDIDVYRRFLKASYTNLDTDDQGGFVKDFGGPSSNGLHPQVASKPSGKLTLAWSIWDFAPPIDSVTNMKPLYTLGNLAVLDSHRPIIVSLSGGVDSMVALHLLRHSAHASRVVAVHINYTNRVECANEVRVLKHWCRVMGVMLYVRAIDEINRKPCMEYELRELYETYTRNVRYGTYRWVRAGAQVVLGHNYDDCLENIMTNIASKSKYDNLWGMQASVVQDGIEFVRPLLQVPKDMIYAYARDHNIPYLRNSTPVWSQRGQIRNDIVPALDKWNGQFVEGLYALSDVTRQLHEVLSTSVRDWLGGNDALPFTRIVHIENMPESTLFWRKVFVSLCGTAPSSKSLDNVLEFIQKVKRECHNDWHGAKRKVSVMKHVILEVSKKVEGTLCVYIGSHS